MLTLTQLKEKGLRPVDRDKPDGCYWKIRDKDWLWFYDERLAQPRPGETEKQKEARLRTWTATQEKYRCPGCNRTPQSLADVKRYRPGALLCVSCGEIEQESIE